MCRLRELEYRGRESPEQTLRLSVPLEDARVATRSDLGSEHKLTPTPAASGLRSAPKTTPEGSERLDRRSEVLNEALAKEVEITVRRRDEIESTAGELAVPQESKDVPISLDADSRKRRVMKAVTAVASSRSSQMEDCAVADESRMDVEEEERSESRSSTELNTRRRIATKTSMDEGRSDETTVAVTTQESLDGIREKAMRIASIDELETGSRAGRWSSPGRDQRTTRTMTL